MITNADTIKEAARIEDVVGDFVTLKQKGTNLMACCPFHSERTPSFAVNPARGIFKCFGCGKGGDAITFLRESGIEYPDALRYIAKKYGVEIQESANGQSDPEMSKKTQLRATASVLQAHLAMSEADTTPGLKYWLERGFKQETLDEFGIGYCDGSKPLHVSYAELSDVGAINDKGNLIFYRRSTIPLHDRNGNVIGWAGRSIEQDDTKAKYINSPNTLIYNKSTHLFNLHRAAKSIRTRQEVWLVEGYADVMAAWQNGMTNVVGLCGTALTDAHVNQLRRFNGDQPLRIVLALDNETTKTGDDEAARTYKASVALAYYTAMEKLLALGEVVRFIYPKPKGKARPKDICDVVMQGSDLDACEKREALEDYVERKLAEDEWKEKASPVQKADFQEHVARLLSKVKRDSVRDVYIKRLYELLELTPKKFGDLVAKYSEKDGEVAYDILDHEYIIIKDEIRQRYPHFDEKTKEISWRYQTLKKSTVTDQFGTAFLKTLPRFTKAIIEPEHINYQRTSQIETALGTYNFFNDYEPLAFTAKPFNLPTGFIENPYGYDYTTIPEIKNIATLMKHIFDSGKNCVGDDYLQIAWDWLAIMYLHPKERLPAIGLVSKEEGTGKSTLINVFAKFFGSNTTKIDSSRIAAKFNALMGGKVLVYCEETKDDRGQMENILKDLITGFEAVIEKKFGDAEVVPTFCKFLFASNHPDTFMKIGTKSTRFFVNEIKAIPPEKKIGNFEELCYMEIPYLAYFLQKRGVMVPYEDRLWFKPERYENEALNRLRHMSKDNVERNIEDLMEKIFLNVTPVNPILSFTSGDIMKMMIAYAGRSYESKTVNYFQDVCVRIGCAYTKSTRRKVYKVEGLYPGGNVEATLSEDAVQGKFLEFPIWKFCAPEQVQEFYSAEKFALLVSSLERAALSGDAHHWFETLKSLTTAPVLEGEEIPF